MVHRAGTGTVQRRWLCDYGWKRSRRLFSDGYIPWLLRFHSGEGFGRFQIRAVLNFWWTFGRGVEASKPRSRGVLDTTPASTTEITVRFYPVDWLLYAAELRESTTTQGLCMSTWTWYTLCLIRVLSSSAGLLILPASRSIERARHGKRPRL
jgi:hypothetical protein